MCEKCVEEINEAIPGLTSVQMLGTGDDPLLFVLKAIESHLNEQGWDQRPQFFALGRNEVGLGASTMVLPESIYYNTAQGLPAFVNWMVNGAPQGVSTKEERYTTLRGCVPENFYGIILFDEGWGLHVDPNTPPDKREEYRLMSEGHRIQEHPDRIEERFGVAVTVDGRLASIRRSRGHEPEFFDSLAGDPTVEYVGGLIPDSLRMLCDICQDAVS
jgi:hypothetical protein